MFNPTVKNLLCKFVIPLIVSMMLPTIKVQTAMAYPEPFSPGDYVTFGRYYHDSAETMEPIVWRVLAVDESELFLLSDKILFFAPFDDVPSDYSYQLEPAGIHAATPDLKYSGEWRDSTIRAYLNGIDTSDPTLHPHIGRDYTKDNFKSFAFTSAEWAMIKETELVEEKTKDKIFLLSFSEAMQFFPETSDRWTQMTAYAGAQNEPDPDDIYAFSAHIRGYGPWFLRTYYNPHLVSCIEANGWEKAGWWVKEPASGIRPALKLNLDTMNALTLVKLTPPPAPVPIIEEIVIPVGYKGVLRADTFAETFVELPYPPIVPRIINGRVMLPFRYFCETVLQGTVEYEAETRKITTWVQGHELVMQVDNPIMTIDGTEVELSQPPIVDEGHTLVPLRAFEPVVTSITWFPLAEQVRMVP